MRRRTQDVNKVQLDIRTGHAQTVEKVLGWLKEEGGVQNVSVADCGCGTGSLAVPLALEGAVVSASDISAVRPSHSPSLHLFHPSCARVVDLAPLCGNCMNIQLYEDSMDGVEIDNVINCARRRLHSRLVRNSTHEPAHHAARGVDARPIRSA